MSPHEESPSSFPAGGTRARRDLSGPAGPRVPSRREAVDGVAGELASADRDAGVERPRLEAERLLCHVLGVDRAELARTHDRELSPREAGRLARVTRRRLAGEPLQHIEGTLEFRELVLLADERAFVPRPETEQLVGEVKRWAREREAEGPVRTVGGREDGRPLLEDALDVGTGSGAIALSLVAEGIAGRAVGLDVSPEALMQAAANRGAADLSEERVEFRVASRPLWSSVSREERFDVIVSNPPYVKDREMDELPAQITEFEPREALAGGADGLDVVREIVEGAHAYLRPGGALFLEIGADQGEAVERLLADAGAWRAVEIGMDLSGRPRFVRARVEEDA